MKPDPRPLLHKALPLLLALGLGATGGTALAQFPASALGGEFGVAGDASPQQPAIAAAHARWQAALAAFSQADRQRQPGNDGVLFVGSSTIRLWSNLQDDFRQVPVIINRGFGGSTMADLNSLVRELVTQYKPKQVLVYAGDNDLAEGRTPEEVLKSFTEFVRTVRRELPGTRIAYISIKPSPSRVALMPLVRRTNTLIADYVRPLPELNYIDIFTPMLNAQGQPRPELFLGDRLHLNAAGYQLWQSVILSHLPALQGAPAPQLASSPARQ